MNRSWHLGGRLNLAFLTEFKRSCLGGHWSSRTLSFHFCVVASLWAFFTPFTLPLVLPPPTENVKLSWNDTRWHQSGAHTPHHTHTHLTSHASVVLAVKHHQSQNPYTHTSPARPHAYAHAQTHTHTCVHAVLHARARLPSDPPYNSTLIGSAEGWRISPSSRNAVIESETCLPVCASVCMHLACFADSGVSIDSKSKTEVCGFPRRPLCEHRSSLSFRARPAHLALRSGGCGVGVPTQLFNTNSNSSSFSRSNDPLRHSISTPPKKK